jgi:hypothetical protein
VGYLGQVTDEVVVPERLTAQYQRFAEILAPYAAQEGKQAEFEAAVQALNAKTTERSQVAADFLASQETQPTTEVLVAQQPKQPTAEAAKGRAGGAFSAYRPSRPR